MACTLVSTKMETSIFHIKKWLIITILTLIQWLIQLQTRLRLAKKQDIKAKSIAREENNLSVLAATEVASL